MALTISAQLDKFVSSYVEQAEAEGLKIAFDSEWPSPCYETTAQDGELVRWSPTLQSPLQSFSNVEEALSLELNPDYCEYFTRYYSDNLKANAPQGRCELLQVFNTEDFERLQQNLIGHLLMKQRLRQAPTLFFGLTDEEDFILTVVNESGEVALEQVGREPAKILAPSLAVFIEQLTPAI
ncbi:protein Syd [Alteromonas sp. KUL17]|uniref:SecY-interacting protein n=1 Tax=Alteromonas sp. KUL17 TaxID=2480796 RepID=UPI0010380E06|nr:SecY-interacting protein [Alteromonas sp. KUL17]TAP31027.1 SecY-interacting protein [Alteromonas sp. KUL17]GEA01145.1 protein Syd [Alteromonas sp. KUL17]